MRSRQILVSASFSYSCNKIPWKIRKRTVQRSVNCEGFILVQFTGCKFSGSSCDCKGTKTSDFVIIFFIQDSRSNLGPEINMHMLSICCESWDVAWTHGQTKSWASTWKLGHAKHEKYSILFFQCYFLQFSSLVVFIPNHIHSSKTWVLD